MKVTDLIGLWVVAVKGEERFRVNNKRRKHVEVAYILFSDNETFLRLEAQDPHDYHDASFTARELYLHRDKSRWADLMLNHENATVDDPFIVFAAH